MNKAKVDNLLERIDKDLVELAKITGATQLAASFVENSVLISDYTDLDNPKFDYYRNEKGVIKNGKTG